MQDTISNEILNLLNHSYEPLGTKEIQEKLKNKIKKESITRTKIFYRLTLLRGEGLIKGKFTGPGKGVWVWWTANAFSTLPNKTYKKRG